MTYIINESERNLIRRMHNNQRSYDALIKESMGLLGNISESVVITDWVSPDDRYLILFDELYDLHTSEKLGDIWENFDNFKLFITHSFEVATNVPQQIKESVLETVKSLVLTESMNDMSKIKPILKQFLKEESFANWVGSGIKKTGEWAADKVKEFGSDVSDIATKGLEGIKKAGLAISQGDWKQVVNLLGSGMVFIARKLRSLLYNPVGIVLDAILVATGIGKSVQWVPWAIVVALDLYEITTGDYEDKEAPTWLRWLMVGTDVLGLVFAGGVAASAKATLSVFRGAKTAEEFAAIAAKNPNTFKVIEKIIGAFSKVPQYLGRAVSYLKSTKLAKAAPWIGSILGKAEGVLANGTKSLTKITSTAKTAGVEGKAIRTAQKVTQAPKNLTKTLKTGTKAGLKTAGAVTAIDKGFKKGVQMYKGLSDAEMEANELVGKSISNYEKETGMTLGAAWDAAE
jgi:hypothetical protein